MTRGVRTSALLAILSLTLPALAGAAPSLELAPAEERFTGDAIAATLTVPTRPGDRVTLAPVELEGFALRSSGSPRFDAKRGVSVIELELVALEPGARWVGPFAVDIHGAGGTTRAESPKRMVEIGSLLARAESLEPKPPSEPLAIMVPDGRMIALLYALLAAVIFLALGALVARALAKRRAARRPPPPPRPPWETALEALARLREERDAGLDEEGIEAWADAVSDVVREYLGARYGFDGLESTTDELVAALHAREPSDARLDDVRAFLRECDLVKFAKARLELVELDRLLDAATRIVTATRGADPAREGAA